MNQGDPAAEPVAVRPLNPAVRKALARPRSGQFGHAVGAASRQEDVGRFDVPVDQSFFLDELAFFGFGGHFDFLGIVQSGQGLVDYFQSLFKGQFASLGQQELVQTALRRSIRG